MRTANIVDLKGELIAEINLPENMGEVKLSQYVNFLKAMETAEEGKNYIPNVLEALSEFYDIDLHELAQAKFSNSSKFIDSVMPLYQWTSKLIQDYQPRLRKGEDLKIKYRGVEFICRGVSISGKFDDLTTMEAYECLEAQRLFRQAEEESQDPNGNLMYSHFLKIVATLCRKEGENLPLGDVERDNFLSERIAFFKDIDAATALDIDFFLSSLLPGSDQYPKTIGFLSRQSLKLVSETKFRKQKQLRMRKPTPGRYSKGRGMAG